MFQSFFPRPRLFFTSAVAWIAIAVALWYGGLEGLGVRLGFPHEPPHAEPVLGLGFFVTPRFLWFYAYCSAFLGVFTLFWFRYAPHRYQLWSILGSALILFTTYFNVQVSVAINNWRRPFFDDVQSALSGSGTRDCSRSVRVDRHLRADRVRLGCDLRGHTVLRQPLCLSLAHCDERLLHVALA